MRWEATKTILTVAVLAAVSLTQAQDKTEEQKRAAEVEAQIRAAIEKHGGDPTVVDEAKKPKPGAKVEDVDLSKAPKLEITPANWEFGEVWYGAPLEKEITIKNVGKGLLKLGQPKTSCGCTASKVGKTDLQPGESTSLKLTYNTKKATVNVNQRVRFTSNDPISPETIVMVRGKVNPMFEFLPSKSAMVSFGQVDSNDSKTQELIIRNLYAQAEGGKKIKLKLPERKVPNYDIKLEEIKDGMEYKLTVSTVPPLPTGSVARQVQLETDLDFMKSLSVRLNAFVMPTVRVNPGILYVSPKLTFPSTKNLTLVYKKGVNLELKEITCTSDKVTWEIVDQPQQQGGARQYKRIKVTVPPGGEIPAQGYELFITTNLDDPKYSKLRVPIKPTPERRPRAARATRPQPLRAVPTQQAEKPKAEAKNQAEG